LRQIRGSQNITGDILADDNSHQPWIRYFGTDQVFGEDGERVPNGTPVIVITSDTHHGSMTAGAMVDMAHATERTRYSFRLAA
jgi:hypothetical protein